MTSERIARGQLGFGAARRALKKKIRFFRFSSVRVVGGLFR